MLEVLEVLEALEVLEVLGGFAHQLCISAVFRETADMPGYVTPG